MASYYGSEKGTIKVSGLDKVRGNNNFFTGVEDEVNLYLDPFVTGYAYIYWVELPGWFEKDADLKNFKELTQKNFRSFQGVSGIELNTAQHQTGFGAREINVPTGISPMSSDFTISHKEYSGGVMRKLYQKWVCMVRDPRTNIALYPSLYKDDNGNNYEYGARNHTGQLLYIVVRPDAANANSSEGIVEYAALYHNVFPTNVPLDTLYNFEIGSQDSPTFDINFKGFVEIGPDVEDYAEKILREKILVTTATTKSEIGPDFTHFADIFGGMKNVNGVANIENYWDNSVMEEIKGNNEE